MVAAAAQSSGPGTAALLTGLAQAHTAFLCARNGNLRFLEIGSFVFRWELRQLRWLAIEERRRAEA